MDRFRIKSLKLVYNIGIVQCVRENESRNTQPLTFCTDIKYAVLRPYIFGIRQQIRDRHAKVTLITQILININGAYPFVSGYIKDSFIRKKAVGICRGHTGKTASLIQNGVGHIRLIRKQLISPHYIDAVRTEHPYLAASSCKGIVSDDIKIIGIGKMVQRRYLPVSHIGDGASRNDPEQVLFDKILTDPKNYFRFEPVRKADVAHRISVLHINSAAVSAHEQPAVLRLLKTEDFRVDHAVRRVKGLNDLSVRKNMHALIRSHCDRTVISLHDSAGPAFEGSVFFAETLIGVGL